MNAIIVSTLLGVIMMFCSWGIKNERVQKNIALVGLLILIVANLAQANAWYVFEYDTIFCKNFNIMFNLFFIR